MNKEDILKMSRAENENQPDEHELMVFGEASRVGLFVGAFICVVLAFVSNLLFHRPEIGYVGWLVYFIMFGSSNVVLFQKLKNRKYLWLAFLELGVGIFFVVLLVIECMV